MHLDVHIVLPHSIGHCKLLDEDNGGPNFQIVVREWVSLAVQDETLMTASVLLGTCRHILCHDSPNDPQMTRMVLGYKSQCLSALRREIHDVDNGNISNMSIAKALALGIDDVVSKDYGVARTHLMGVLAMVEKGGGMKEMGISWLLRRMCLRFCEELL